MVHSQIYANTRASDSSAEKSIHKSRIDCKEGYDEKSTIPIGKGVRQRCIFISIAVQYLC